MNMKNPPHVGEMVDTILEESGLSVTDGARALKVSRQSLSELVNCKRGLSPEMALRLEVVFGGSADSWMRNQTAYDMAQVRHNAGNITDGLERLVLP